MAQASKAPAPDDEVTRLRTQTARLRARVEELETELARKAPQRVSRGSDGADTSRDKRARVMDGASEITRGLAHVSVEALRATADVVGGVVGTAYDRNRPNEDVSVWDRAEQAPVDLVTFFKEGVNRVLDIPIRAIDTLYNRSRMGEDRRGGG